MLLFTEPIAEYSFYQPLLVFLEENGFNPADRGEQSYQRAVSLDPARVATSDWIGPSNCDENDSLSFLCVCGSAQTRMGT